jgi:hypothetical protein
MSGPMMPAHSFTASADAGVMSDEPTSFCSFGHVSAVPPVPRWSNITKR